MTLAARLTAVDAIVLLLMLVLAVRGSIRGFAWQAIRTGAVIAGFFLAGRLGAPAGAFVAQHVDVPTARQDEIGWLLVWLLTYFAGTWVAHLVRDAVRRIRLGAPDRLLGAALGAVFGLALAAFGLVLWASTKEPAEIRRSLGDSATVDWMARLVRAAKPMFSPGVVRRWEPVLDSLEAARAR